MTSVTEGLLPCPFCGGEAVLVPTLDTTVREWFVTCGNLECNVLACKTKRFYTEAEAIEAWNTRAYTVADNDAEVYGDVAQGLFRDLVEADPETAGIWARSWPELFGKEDANDRDR